MEINEDVVLSAQGSYTSQKGNPLHFFIMNLANTLMIIWVKDGERQGHVLMQVGLKDKE